MHGCNYITPMISIRFRLELKEQIKKYIHLRNNNQEGPCEKISHIIKYYILL